MSDYDRTYYHSFRHVLRWRLWEAIPRANRLVSHWEDPTTSRTLCGQPMSRGGGRFIALHRTVAEAIGADECKACQRGLAS